MNTRLVAHLAKMENMDHIIESTTKQLKKVRSTFISIIYVFFSTRMVSKIVFDRRHIFDLEVTQLILVHVRGVLDAFTVSVFLYL